MIKFECNKGYKLRGSAKLKCNAGVWEGQFPECEGKFTCYVNSNDAINISKYEYIENNRWARVDMEFFFELNTFFI